MKLVEKSLSFFSILHDSVKVDWEQSSSKLLMI
jgi:hypothetical protein